LARFNIGNIKHKDQHLNTSTHHLHCHYSTQLERLLATFSSLLDEMPIDAFKPHCLVIPHPDLGGWITTSLAEQRGIVAHIDFIALEQLVPLFVRGWWPDLANQPYCTRQHLIWHLHHHLPAWVADQAVCAHLNDYLQTEPRTLSRYQLSVHLATLFERYLVWQPDLLCTWQHQQQTHWQAIIWRALAASLPCWHHVTIWQRLNDPELHLQKLSDTHPFAPQLLIFHPSRLPPLVTRLIQLLTHHQPVHLFLLAPVTVSTSSQPDHAAKTSPINKGHTPLIVHLQQHGLETWVQAPWLQNAQIHNEIAPVPPPHALAWLQQRLINPHFMLTDDAVAASDPLHDQSIRIHDAHSPLREVQILHDQLLDWFNRSHQPGHTPLEPRDIIVMAPDISRYSSLIDAVFAAAPPARHIPWYITQHDNNHAQLLLTTILEWLNLISSRFQVSELFKWLDTPAVSRQFNLSPLALQQLRRWVQENNICWGLNGTMRTEHQLPGTNEHSWQFGLQRLFLGYALPSTEEFYQAYAPYPDIEGQEAIPLGELQRFIDYLAEWRQWLGTARSVSDWHQGLALRLALLCKPEDAEQAVLTRLWQHLDHLVITSGDACLSVDVLRQFLQHHWPLQHDLLRNDVNRVVCCHFIAGRIPPKRVIAILGMDSQQFPQQTTTPACDPLTKALEANEPNPHFVARWLWLDTLFAARDHLHISSVGHSLQDNRPQQRALVVQYMLDELTQYPPLQHLTTQTNVAIPWLIEHPLQPFSDRYFNGAEPQLFSYNDAWLNVTRQQLITPVAPFIETPLVAEAITQLDIASWLQFFKKPLQTFLKQRVGIRIESQKPLFKDHEPFKLEPLDQWQLKQEILKYLSDHDDNEEFLQNSQEERINDLVTRLHRKGLLPHGLAGARAVQQFIPEVEEYHSRYKKLRQHFKDDVEPIPVKHTFGQQSIQLTGVIGSVTQQGLFTARLGKQRGRDILALWIQHLLLNLIKPEDVTLESYFLGFKKTKKLELFCLHPVNDPKPILDDLMDFWCQGQCQPLPFFPDLSWDWYKSAKRDSKKVLKPIKAKNDNPFDEFKQSFDDEFKQAVHLAFRAKLDLDTFDDTFQMLSTRIFDPLNMVKEFDTIAQFN
jgi:exodeoxyribonuclease V gamma subunit